MNPRFRKFLEFPLTKIILSVVLLVAITVGAQLLTEKIAAQVGIQYQLSRVLTGLMGSAAALVTYVLFFRWLEKRRITELSASSIFWHLSAGIFLGALLQSLTILVIWLSGGFFILSVNPLLFLVPPFMMAITSAIFEELLVRGIIFRILEEKLGTYVALIISAVIFGALHLANPNSSLLAATGLALQAGVFLAAAYVYTRNLWFPIAIHFAWNFTQGGIYGASVSGGRSSKSLFTTSITGNPWVTGGDFGPEGSLQATLFCFSVALFLLHRSHNKGRIIAPYWKR